MFIKDEHTLSLLHFNDKENLIKDECDNNIWTLHGDELQYVDDNYEIGPCIYFNGNSYLRMPIPISDTQDFTIECNFLISSDDINIFKKNNIICLFQWYNSNISSYEDKSNSWFSVVFLKENNNIVMKVYSFNYYLHNNSINIQKDIAYHIAIIRNNNTNFKFYVNGICVAEFSNNLKSAGYISIGHGGIESENKYNFSGYINEFRLSDIVRYENNFGRYIYTSNYINDHFIIIPNTVNQNNLNDNNSFNYPLVDDNNNSYNYLRYNINDSLKEIFISDHYIIIPNAVNNNVIYNDNSFNYPLVDDNNNSYNYLKYNINEGLRKLIVKDELFIYPSRMEHYIIYNDNSFNYPLVDDNNNNSYNYLKYNINEGLREITVEDELLIYPLMNHYVSYNDNSFNYPLLNDENNSSYNYMRYNINDILKEIFISDHYIIIPNAVNNNVIYNNNSFNYPLLSDENNNLYNYLTYNIIRDILKELPMEENFNFKIIYRLKTYYIFDLWTLTKPIINIW